MEKDSAMIVKIGNNHINSNYIVCVRKFNSEYTAEDYGIKITTINRVYESMIGPKEERDLLFDHIIDSINVDSTVIPPNILPNVTLSLEEVKEILDIEK